MSKWDDFVGMVAKVPDEQWPAFCREMRMKAFSDGRSEAEIAALTNDLAQARQEATR